MINVAAAAATMLFYGAEPSAAIKLATQSTKWAVA